MAFKPTKPLTGDELCSVRPLWPRPIVAAVIVGDRSPAQGSPGLYRQIFRLSYHSPDEVGPRMDEETEAALDAEPVILENSGHTSENYKYGRCGMSDNNRLSRKLAALIIAPWTTKTFPRN